MGDLPSSFHTNSVQETLQSQTSTKKEHFLQVIIIIMYSELASRLLSEYWLEADVLFHVFQETPYVLFVLIAHPSFVNRNLAVQL